MLVMKPYSEDLRRQDRRRPRGRDAQNPSRPLVRPQPLSSVKRYCRLAAYEEPLAPRKGGGRPPKANAAVASLLEEDVDRRPYAVGYRNQKLPVGDHGALGDALATMWLIEEMARG